MQYAERPLPPELGGQVAAIWTMAVESDDWTAHEALPDGCVELIRRHSGRSVWHREQPALFATGLGTVPASLRFSGDARFTAIKLWPWAWHALGGPPCAGFENDWIEIPAASPLAALLPEAGDPIPGLIAALDGKDDLLGTAILASTSVAQILARTGLTHRQLQRRFAREFGMPPRSYLRLLRLRGALADLQQGPGTLAETAAGQGYADQAHMARDFRTLAGLPPRDARARAKGPFV